MFAIRRLLPPLNAVAFLATLVVNTLATTLPLNGRTTRELAEGYSTLFLPAGFAFSIWGLIYLGVGLLIIYQFTAPRNEVLEVVDTIGWLLLLSSLLNTAWIFAWHYERVILSLVFMLSLLIVLVLIYGRLQRRRKVSVAEQRFVHIPISLYLSWIFALSIANIAVTLISLGWEGSGLSLETWTITGIVAVGVVTWALLKANDDIWFAMVSVWAAAGALVRHVVYLQGQYRRIIMWLGVSLLLVSAKIILIVARRSHKTLL